MAQAMCSHKSIAWEITDNTVVDRMIDNSLIHKFRSSRRIRKRTKVLNAEIKKHSVKEYKYYVELKTNVLRNLLNDTDTSDSSNLTDIDYDIIYSSPSKQAKYVTENFEKCIFTSEEDCGGYKKVSIKRGKKSNGRSTERRVQTRKSLLVKHPMESKECVNTGWQEIEKNDSKLRKRMRENIPGNEGSILEDNNRYKTRSSERALSSRFDSQNCMASTVIKSINKTKRDHRNYNAMNNEISSKDSTISNKRKRVKKIRNNKNQSAAINDSNTGFNSHDLHYQSSPSRSTIVENNNKSDNELNTLDKSEDNSSNKLTVVINESSTNAKNLDNTTVSNKPELLKNVRRNLIPALEKANSTNNDKDIKTDKNIEDELNYDQLYSSIAIDNRHSTPLNKTQTKRKDLSPDASLLDQQKDSGIDDDSQDRLVKIKKSNNISTIQNMEENAEKTPISSQRPKKIDEVIETVENCKDVKNVHLKFNDDILEKQISEEKEPFGEKEINSPQLNQINTNVDTNQEDKEDEHFAKVEDSSDIQNQQLLFSKQDCEKDAHSEPCDHIQEKEDNREAKKPAGDEEISLELNKVDKDGKVSSINHKGKTRFLKQESLYDQKQRS